MNRRFRSKGMRFLAGFLALCMTVSLCPAEVFAKESVTKVHYGDVNKDGKIDQNDVEALKKYLAEHQGVKIDENAADVNVNKQVDIQDLLLIERKAAGEEIILGERVRITFDARGGTAVEPIDLCKGASLASIVDKVPTTQKKDAIFTGWYVNVFDRKDYDTAGQPYLWVRLAEGENYKASEVKQADSAFAWGAKPKSLLFPEVFKYFVTIKTGDKKNGLIQEAGTDSTINFDVEDIRTRKDGNGKPFDAKQIDTFQLNIDSDKLYHKSYGSIPVALSMTKHGAAPGWFCDKFWFYRGKENPYVDGEGRIVGGVGEEHIVDHWFTDNDTYEYADMNGFIRDITEWSGFSESDAATDVEVTKKAETFAWSWLNPGITDGNAELTYNPYEHINAPELSVTFGNAEYDRYITQGMYDFKVDNSGLYQAMAENQEASLELTYALAFKPVDGNASTTAETAKRVKTVRFTCPDVAQSARPVQTFQSRSLQMLRNRAVQVLGDGVSFGLSPSAQVMVQQGVVSTISDVRPNKEGKFDVTYSIGENPGMWGMKFAVNFDQNKVELLDSRIGTVFDQKELIEPDQKTTAKGRYVFLAARESVDGTFTDTDQTGTLVTLTFRVKDQKIQDSIDKLLLLDALQAVSVESERGAVMTPVLQLRQAIQQIFLFGFCLQVLRQQQAQEAFSANAGENKSSYVM